MPLFLFLKKIKKITAAGHVEMWETAWSTEPVEKMLENVFLFFNIFPTGGVSSFPHFHMAKDIAATSLLNILHIAFINLFFLK